MHELYKLRDNLCDELKDYANKGVTAGTLDTIDKLAHATKNLDKVIEYCEDDEEYSSRSYPDGMGGSYRHSYAGRRRDSMGRYSGRYSRDGEHPDVQELRREIQKITEKVDRM